MTKIIVSIIFIREYYFSINLAYGGCDKNKNKNSIEFLIFPSFKSNELFVSSTFVDLFLFDLIYKCCSTD